MRKSIAALALIQRERDGQTLWLAQWNKRWNAFSLVGGHKRPDESFRDCVIREVFEELDLMPGLEFDVSEQPRARLEYTDRSDSAGEETAYEIELFDVNVKGGSAHEKISADVANRWLSAEEIEQRSCADGQPVSRTVGKCLRGAGPDL